MQAKVTGEEAVKALNNQVMIGPSENGYTFAYGVTKDGDFTEYDEATPAGESLIVNGIMRYSYFKLMGNEGEVDIIL